VDDKPPDPSDRATVDRGSKGERMGEDVERVLIRRTRKPEEFEWADRIEINFSSSGEEELRKLARRFKYGRVTRT